MNNYFKKKKFLHFFFLALLFILNIRCSSEKPAAQEQPQEGNEQKFKTNSPFSDPNNPIDPSAPGVNAFYYSDFLQQISMGKDHYCFVFPNQKVKCWGSNSKGQIGTRSAKNTTPEENLSNPDEKFIAGSFDDDNDPVDLQGVVQVSAGETSTCALLNSKRVKCWGSGLLGSGQNETNQYLPKYVHSAIGNNSPLENIVKIVSGKNFYCGLTSSGKVKCWGNGSLGRLGNGSTTNKTAPVNVLQKSGGPALANVVNIAAGFDHACAIIKDSSLKCWGNGFNGKLGNGQTANSTYPVTVLLGSNNSCSSDNTSNLTGVVQVALSKSSSCAALNSKEVICWGKGNYGQLGNKITPSEDHINPCALGKVLTNSESYLANAVRLAAGGADIFSALLKNGKVKSWGETASAAITSSVAVNVEESSVAISNIKQITGRNDRFCAMRKTNDYYSENGNGNGNDRDLFCWGTSAPTVSESDVPYPYNAQFYCDEKANCNINPTSLYALKLTLTSDNEASIEILNLKAGDHVSLHNDKNCTDNKILEGTVSTGSSSLSLTIQTDNLSSDKYNYYAKVNNKNCSVQFATLIVP